MLSKRQFLFGAGAVTVGATIYGVSELRYTNVAAAGTSIMDAEQAYKAVQAGEILLVDVRRPDEWQRTGIADGAIQIDMRRPDFIDVLKKARLSKEHLPVAVICARGVRSKHMTGVITGAGIGPIIDIPEGMLGSSGGPGWLARQLPIKPWSA